MQSAVHLLTAKLKTTKYVTTFCRDHQNSRNAPTTPPE